jgi:hypothetical protein
LIEELFFLRVAGHFFFEFVSGFRFYLALFNHTLTFNNLTTQMQYSINLLISSNQVVVQHANSINESNQHGVGFLEHGFDFLGCPCPHIKNHVAQAARGYDGESVLAN